MFQYEKKLQYPVNIKTPNPKLAQLIITQLGGPDGELGASLRYLNQRFAAPYAQVKAVLTDIGTEEFAHRLWTQIAGQANTSLSRYIYVSLPLLFKTSIALVRTF